MLKKPQHLDELLGVRPLSHIPCREHGSGPEHLSDSFALA